MRKARKPVAQLLDTIALWRKGEDTARTGMSAEQGELEAVGAAIDGLMNELSARQQLRRPIRQEADFTVKGQQAYSQPSSCFD